MEKINESSSQVLTNMYNFYKKRYGSNPSEMEKRFNKACKDLIDTNDVSHLDYIDFCVTHDIEPEIEEKPKKTTSSSSSSDSCGHTSWNRGGC